MTVATGKPAKSEIQRISPLPKPVSVEQFLDWYPEDSEYRYELRRGVIIQMPKPRGKHSEVAGFSHDELAFEIRREDLPYLIPRECIVKVSDDTGFEPDVIVLDRAALKSEPLWDKASTIENGASIKLVIEVVSTNWQDDYEVKLAAYEAMGIPEYWILDYAGLGGVRHIGKPKQPTLTICRLVEGEYEVTRVRAEERIVSEIFPKLDFRAGLLFKQDQQG
ncbi:MAG: Uma2 family endonuclease [Synechococcales cyanobacterium RM1_1_8]|nr:Uma2 family endonuclease [Synechococcales cyanobacterium RM1_1_8]